ncbi:outer membrane lipoprotein-sorting protein [Marinospirillum sp.]|uniref:outer membrane lipoprotein-sorting protein n=1 Tax=Marinospirillum sp. TaxID=2183934 RepID=UPI002870894B|nr:outer membrane lipoprotein-sorting protein [Marinospirillum sp.]MDR9468231.1 outer membrane lipoprotein-sorting protein [Marinospirillum sp.]
MKANLLKMATGLLGGATLMLSSSLIMAAPPVQEIIEKANQASYYAGQDGRAEARMKIEDKDGRTQTRQFTVLRQDVEGSDQQNYLVVFSRPSEYRDTVFLVHKKPQAGDDRWLYLPDLDLVRRIAPGDKRTSFVGAHVYYEDISGRNLNQDEHKLVEETDDQYVLKSTPKNPGEVEFASFQTWIDKETWLPMRIEYTDDEGEVYRIMENAGVEVVDGYPTPMMMRVQDLKSGGQTIVQFRGASYDLGIPDSVFTERSLRNPPSDWLERR